MTGLSGSGKTTLAQEIIDYLNIHEPYNKVIMLDGDIIRKVLPTGFSKKDRLDHASRVVTTAAILEASGFVVLVSLISPYKASRVLAKSACQNVSEVYVKASLETCIRRDPKGLYKKALAGEIKNFTGLDDPYEEPTNPDLELNTAFFSIAECRDKLLQIMSHV